jgi:hypothetical protein
MNRIFQILLIRPIYKRAARYYHSIIERIKNKEILNKWLQDGKPVPPPHIYKQQTIKEYQKWFNLQILVETGTYMGDMVLATNKLFEQVYSVELEKTLAKKAQDKFKFFKHIQIMQGDSSDELPNILSKIQDPALFWLDGHYSEGITAKGRLSTPIIQELTHILNHFVKDHVILIDDARCFNGKDDYPTLEELKTFVNNKRPSAAIEIKDDIIRIK